MFRERGCFGRPKYPSGRCSGPSASGGSLQRVRGDKRNISSERAFETSRVRSVHIASCTSNSALFPHDSHCALRPGNIDFSIAATARMRTAASRDGRPACWQPRRGPCPARPAMLANKVRLAWSRERITRAEQTWPRNWRLQNAQRNRSCIRRFSAQYFAKIFRR